MPRKLTKQEALEIYGIDIDKVIERNNAPQVRIRKAADTPFLFNDIMKQRRQQQWVEEHYAVRKAKEPRANDDEQRTNTINDSDKVSAKIRDLAASLIVASSGKINEQQATHFILHTPHGRAMFERFSKQQKDTQPMHIDIHKLMPAIEIMEEGMQARAKLERHDGEIVAKSFTRLYEGDLAFRKTCKTIQEAKHFVALSKVNVMPTSVVSTEVGSTAVKSDAEKAIAQLNAQAERAHRTFTEEFLDPANAGLAAATYTSAHRGSSIAYSAEE